MKWMRARPLAPMAIAAILALGFAGCSQRAQDSGATALPAVPLSVAHPGAIDNVVDAIGKVGPPAGSSAKVAFAEAGILKSLDVRVGQTVAAGDALAGLDTAPFAGPLAEARADALAATASAAGGTVANAALQSAHAKVTLALAKLATLHGGGAGVTSDRIAAREAARAAAFKLDADVAALARAQQLFEAGVIARKDLDAARLTVEGDRAERRSADARDTASDSDVTNARLQAEADIAAARSDAATSQTQRAILAAQADSARARVDAARVAFDNATLTAPADGVVLAVFKHVGEAVDASTPVVEIGPATQREVTLTVPGDRAAEIVAGDPVTLRGSSHTAAGTHGRVLAVVPEVDPATRLAVVVVAGAPPHAPAGEAVDARIVTGTTSGIIVPNSAIVEDPETGKTVVFVAVEHPKAGSAPFEQRTVIVRAGDATRSVIGSGLRSNERVAASGGYLLLAPQGD